MAGCSARPPEAKLIRVAIVCQDANFGGALASMAERGEVEVVSLTNDLADLGKVAAAQELHAVVAIDPAAFVPDKAVEHADGLPLLMIGPGEDRLLIEAVEAGCLGYADETEPLEDLVLAMKTVADGVAVVPPHLLGALLRHVVQRQRRQRQAREVLSVLSPRELDVFELAARGLDKAAVAAELFISPATARTHIQNVYRKLDLHSSADLVALAAACGLEVSRPSGGVA